MKKIIKTIRETCLLHKWVATNRIFSVYGERNRWELNTRLHFSELMRNKNFYRLCQCSKCGNLKFKKCKEGEIPTHEELINQLIMDSGLVAKTNSEVADKIAKLKGKMKQIKNEIASHEELDVKAYNKIVDDTPPKSYSECSGSK